MPKKFCPAVGCTNIIAYGDKHCSLHVTKNILKDSTKFYDKYKRDQSRSKFYHSTQWKNIRKIKLMRDPLCVWCGELGQIVDHIEEISDGGSATCIDNLQTLCKSCHNKKTSIKSKERLSTMGGI